MPTFQSIGLHPELRNRLVTESRVNASDPSSCSDNDKNTSRQQHQSVPTPQALLSRNPATLRILDSTDQHKSYPIALAHVQKLRCEVAEALIAQSETGEWIRRIQKSQSLTSDDRCSTQMIRHSHTTTAIQGTVSALDLLRYATQNEATNVLLSTGCRTLDQALAIPYEYQCISIYRGSENRTQSMPVGGIPFGYVTQFTGPPGSGKTQLALHLAAKNINLHKTWLLSSNAAIQTQVQRFAVLCHNNQTVLERTHFFYVYDEYQVLRRLAELEMYLQQSSSNQSQQQILLILDSVSGCIKSSSAAPILSSDTDLLGLVAMTLRRLTRHYALATVLMNGTVSNREFSTSSNRRQWQPALGRLWATTSDIHVWLEPATIQLGTDCNMSSDQSHRRIHAKIERHCYKELDNNHNKDATAATFYLTEDGIQDQK